MNPLLTLAGALAVAAEALEQDGSMYRRAWAAHFRADRRAVLLMAETWREPATKEVEV